MKRLLSSLLLMLFSLGRHCGDVVPVENATAVTRVTANAEISKRDIGIPSMLILPEELSEEEKAKWIPQMLVLPEETTTEEAEAVEETTEATETADTEEVVEETEATETTDTEEVVEETEATEAADAEEVTEETEATETAEAEEVTEETEATETADAEEATEATEETEVTEIVDEEEAIEATEETEATETAEAEESIEVTEITDVEEIPEETTEIAGAKDYHTGRLTARKGYITDSPCGPNGNDGSETWYPDAPGGAVKIMEQLYGFKDLEMTVREDGVRILSGTRPNGKTFKDLVVVAADIKYIVVEVGVKCIRNPDGIFERGDIVETSLGTGIVVDFCERAVNERKQSGHVHIDIATTW